MSSHYESNPEATRPISPIYENLSSFGSSTKPNVSVPTVEKKTPVYCRPVPSTPPLPVSYQINRTPQSSASYSNQPAQMMMPNNVNRNGSSYRREYTLNEIFDNLKKFKRQAKEQEMLSSMCEPTRLPPPNLAYTNTMIVQPTRHLNGHEYNFKNDINSQNNHVYVNQRIITTTHVPNGTFV